MGDAQAVVRDTAVMPVQGHSGAPLARGNTSDLWLWSDTAVVKVLHPGIPSHWASTEADIIARVHAAGLPVPQVEGVVEFEGRPGIVLERVDGPVMWERMKTDPSTVPELIDQLLALQAEVQRTFVPQLISIDERLRAKIGEAERLGPDDRAVALRLLEMLPGGDALCHGDFHPANIILSDRGPVIVDWFDAVRGPATADYVRSSLLMRPPSEPNAWLAGGTPELMKYIHGQYLGELVRRGTLDEEAFGPWEATMAAARLAEPVPHADLLKVWHSWRADGSVSARRLLQDCREPTTVGRFGD